MSKLFIFLAMALLLLGIAQAIPVTVQERTTLVPYWQTNPCIDAVISNATTFSIDVYAITCSFVNDADIIEATCYNSTVKAIAFWNTPYATSSAWQNLTSAKKLELFAWLFDYWSSPEDQGFITMEDDDYPLSPNWYNVVGVETSRIQIPCRIGMVNGYSCGTIPTLPVPAKYSVVFPTLYGTATSIPGYTSARFLYPNESISVFHFTFPTTVPQGDYQLKIYAEEQGNVTTPWNIMLLNFSVSADGVEFGECNSTIGASGTAGYVATHNPFSSLPYPIVWYSLIMLIVGAGILIVSRMHAAGVGITIFVELCLLFLGTYWHIIPVVIMLCLAVALAAWGALLMRKVFA